MDSVVRPRQVRERESSSEQGTSAPRAVHTGTPRAMGGKPLTSADYPALWLHACMHKHVRICSCAHNLSTLAHTLNTLCTRAHMHMHDTHNVSTLVHTLNMLYTCAPAYAAVKHKSIMHAHMHTGMHAHGFMHKSTSTQNSAHWCAFAHAHTQQPCSVPPWN